MSVYPAWRRPTRLFLTESDPYFSSVKLLLHFSGANNSTSFLDSSSLNQSVTAGGSAVISTAQGKFNSSSLYLNGSSILSFPTITLSGQFTVECFFYALDAGDRALFGCTSDNIQFPRFQNSFTNIFGYANGLLYNVNYSLSPNQWYHIATSRDSSNNVYLFVNGTLVSTTTLSNSIPINIIGAGYLGSSNYFYGYMDEVRVSAVCRYASNFSVPVSAYPDF